MAPGPPEEEKRAWLAAARSSSAQSPDQAPDHPAGSENPRWGYLRIGGELLKLAIDVSATTIATVLREGGLGLAPRRIGPTWTQFLRLQAYGLLSPGAPSEKDSLEDLPSRPGAMSVDPDTAETDEPIRDEPPHRRGPLCTTPACRPEDAFPAGWSSRSTRPRDSRLIVR